MRTIEGQTWEDRLSCSYPVRGYYTGGRDSYGNSRDGYEGGGGREGYDLGEGGGWGRTWVTAGRMGRLAWSLCQGRNFTIGLTSELYVNYVRLSDLDITSFSINKCNNDRNCSFLPDYFFVRLENIWYETYNHTHSLKHLMLLTTI